MPGNGQQFSGSFWFPKPNYILPKSSDGVRQLRHGSEELLPPIGNLAKPESHPILPETHPGGILVVCISTLLLGLICVSFMVAILSQMERDCHPPMLEPPLHLSSTANPLDCHKEDSSRLSRRSQGTRCRRPETQFLSVFSQSDLGHPNPKIASLSFHLPISIP